MNPLVSVIIPIYNAEKYLDRCIKSVINQTYKNLEIILIDDGSLDRSSIICDNYASMDCRVKVVHKENGGVCSARNKGLDIATGDFIGFIDSDDWIDASMYERLVFACEDNETIGTIGSNQVTEDGCITVKRSFIDKEIDAEMFLHNILCRLDGCAVWSRLIPRNIIGDSRFNEKKLNEETLFWMSIMPRIKKVRYISDIGYFYFQRTGSLSRIFGKSVYDMVKNAKEMRSYVEEKFPRLNKEAEYFEIFQNMTFLLCCPFNHDRKNDPAYQEVYNFIVRNRVEGIKNPYFKCKDKMKLIGVSLCPKCMSLLLIIKNKSL